MKEIENTVITSLKTEVSVETIVQFKEKYLTDQGYGELVKLSPLLKKMLPKPYVATLKRKELNEFLYKLDPSDTPDGFDVDPEILFIFLVKAYNLLEVSTFWMLPK